MNVSRQGRSALMAGAALILLAACSGEGDTRDTASSASGSESPSPEPDYVLLLDDESVPDQVQGEPGTYALTARGDGTPPLAVLDVPAGFSNFGYFALWPDGSGDADAPDVDPRYQAVQYWTVHGVFPDPCDRHGADAPEAGTSVEDLAAALQDQKLTSTTKPTPVTLDGYDGLYLELSAPPDLDFADCELGYYLLWEAAPGDAQHSLESPATVERIWVLDVDGGRVVLIAGAGPRVPPAEVQALTHMVESVRFVEPS
jgi:hypothetical protein